MSANMSVSIVESGPSTPNTGIFSIHGSEAAISIGCGALVIIFAILGIIFGIKSRKRSHISMDRYGKKKLGFSFRTIVGLGLILLVGAGLMGGFINSEEINIGSVFAANDSLTVTAEDIDLELVRKDKTAYNAVANKVTVGEPGANGYTLSAYVTSTDLISEKSEENKIAVVEGNNVALGDNTWGVALSEPTSESSTVFNAMPTTFADALQIKKTTSAGNIETTVYYGAYVTDEMPYGTYTGVTVNYVAVANPDPVIADLTYMQDFAGLSSTQLASVKNSMTAEQQYTLKDNRDNKTYYVSKLKDGNVWMTQNLDLDIDSSVTYTPADTDIPANWTPSTSTYATGVTTWNDSNVSPESYDPGNLCWDGVLKSNGDTLDNSTVACNSGNINYSIGNYYNWTAAVAMNNSISYTAQDEDVNQSICPAGWMLPKSGMIQTGSGSFNYLISQQGLTSGMSGNIQNTPVYFTYGGNWYGESWNVGSRGDYYSSVVYDAIALYGLFFNVSGLLNPQGGGVRSDGSSVRCVAR